MPRHVSLNQVPTGRTVSVVAIHGGEGVHARLSALGIRPGTSITKVSGSFGRGPVVVRHGRNQTALGSGICEKIIVEVRE
jgi:ferrous iron transport protein A